MVSSRVTENLDCFWLGSYKNTSESPLRNSWFLVHKSDLVSPFSLYALMRSAEPLRVFRVFPWETSWEEDSGQGRDSRCLSPLARCLLKKLNLQSVYRNQEQKVVAVTAGSQHCTRRWAFGQTHQRLSRLSASGRPSGHPSVCDPVLGKEQSK